MSDSTLLDEPGSLRWTTRPFDPATRTRHRSPVLTRMETSELPVVGPGEMWLVEVPLAGPELAPLEYGALRTANVVIYDRSLGDIVAGHLPLGGYAEPAASSQAQSGSTYERSVRFFRDGWSVARLFYPGLASSGQRLGNIPQLRHRLLSLGAPADLPVRLFVSDNHGSYEKHRGPFNGIDAIVAEYASVEAATLTVAFDATRTGWPSRFSIASTNGLAG